MARRENLTIRELGKRVAGARGKNVSNRFAFFHDPDGTALYFVQPTVGSD